MKIILNIISFLAILSVVYLSLTNTQNIEIINNTINLAIYTITILCVGILAGSCIFGQFYLSEKNKLNAYKRELEKSSVTNSSNSSKVQVLEAKIATLEKALQDALNK